ncbi:hypothetical protein D0784_06635 [Vibrio campbellii]|nr:hypothetical protein M892_00400 [Vibrio campbellii ATCC BAA-1116]APX06513.1 hypothetical protein BWP24_10215 [Vibrio campbellii]ARR06702.1 hypothetical protein Vc3S01_1940 [Vibrio campbellii]ARR44761.1 hypothetical protein CAY59_10605 [Vibrio campbellii]AUV86442.1 hypothetical protein C1N50_09905 [Vibrio campbellii]
MTDIKTNIANHKYRFKQAPWKCANASIDDFTVLQKAKSAAFATPFWIISQQMFKRTVAQTHA